MVQELAAFAEDTLDFRAGEPADQVPQVHRMVHNRTTAGQGRVDEPEPGNLTVIDRGDGKHISDHACIDSSLGGYYIGVETHRKGVHYLNTSLPCSSKHGLRISNCRCKRLFNQNVEAFLRSCYADLGVVTVVGTDNHPVQLLIEQSFIGPIVGCLEFGSHLLTALFILICDADKHNFRVFQQLLGVAQCMHVLKADNSDS